MADALINIADALINIADALINIADAVMKHCHFTPIGALIEKSVIVKLYFYERNNLFLQILVCNLLLKYISWHWRQSCQKCSVTHTWVINWTESMTRLSD